MASGWYNVAYFRGSTVTKELREMLDVAKSVEMSSEEKEEQRRSFAFGNANIENPSVTREIVDMEADELNRK